MLYDNRRRKNFINIVGALLILLAFGGSSSANIITVDDSGGADYTKIQDAINASVSGDTILVNSGTYYENVNVSKQLILNGVDTGEGKPVIDAGGNGNVIELSAGNSVLEGFTVIGSAGYRMWEYAGAGIVVTSNNNKVIRNNASNNGIGIILSDSNYNTLIGNNANLNFYYGKYGAILGSGIMLSSSGNNTLTDNNASNNGYSGIDLYSSGNNTLTGNNASNNSYSGISLYYSHKILLINNTMNRNNYNFGIEGNSDSDFDDRIDTSNLVDGKPIYFIKGAKNIVYDSHTNAGTFYCIKCMNVTLINLDLKNNFYGIFFWKTSRSKIQNVTASNNNKNGIALYYSSKNTLIDNNASLNNLGEDSYASGIFLEFANNNILTGNNASNNIYGISLSSSNKNRLIKNNANLNNFVGISLSSSRNNMLIDNTALFNFWGIRLSSYSNETTLKRNNASNNNYGFELDSSGKNTLIENNALNNTDAGINLLYASKKNKIYNNIFNNVNNVRFYHSGKNIWNTTQKSGTNIVGGSYLGGNFWANPNGSGFGQVCPDVNSDGICDDPFVLDANNTDYLPLSYKHPHIYFADPTPANGSSQIRDYAYINTKVSGSTAFIDWNNSLSGWWRFNKENGENATFFRDWSIQGNNAKCSGTECPVFVSGKFGKALNFDGVNDYLDAGNKANLNIEDAITIETWINPAIAQEKCWDEVSGNYGVMSKVGGSANSANWSWQLRYGAPGRCYLGFQFNGNPEGSRWVTVKKNLTPGQWYHIVGTFNGKDIRLYLNGKLRNSNKISAIKGYRNNLLIGNDGWANYFNGKIDEVRIHRRALSSKEIKASYDAGKYRLYRNFTNLANGDYNYRAYVQNLQGSVDQTEKRTLHIIPATST